MGSKMHMSNKEIAEYIAKTLFERRLMEYDMTVEQAVEYFYTVLKEADQAIDVRRPIR
jgi:hypothetical protein